MLLPHVCQFHRTAFHLDFDQTELMAETHPSLASMLLGSPAMRQSAQAVLSHARPYVVRGEQRLLVYASYVWGEDYATQSSAGTLVHCVFGHSNSRFCW